MVEHMTFNHGVRSSSLLWLIESLFYLHGKRNVECMLICCTLYFLYKFLWKELVLLDFQTISKQFLLTKQNKCSILIFVSKIKKKKPIVSDSVGAPTRIDFFKYIHTNSLSRRTWIWKSWTLITILHILFG